MPSADPGSPDIPSPEFLTDSEYAFLANLCQYAEHHGHGSVRGELVVAFFARLFRHAMAGHEGAARLLIEGALSTPSAQIGTGLASFDTAITQVIERFANHPEVAWRGLLWTSHQRAIRLAEPIAVNLIDDASPVRRRFALENILFAQERLWDRRPDAASMADWLAMLAEPTTELAKAQSTAWQGWDGRRPLRVAFVGSRFSQPSIQMMMTGLFEFFDRRHASPIAYSCEAVIPELTLRRAADGWRFVGDLTDDLIAARMIEDQIDVAVMMDPFLPGTRYGLLTKNAAPCWVLWTDCIAETGLSLFDAILADPILIPKTQRNRISPPVLDLPGTWQPLRSMQQAEIHVPDRKSDGDRFVFGCRADPETIGADMLLCWAGILRSLPYAELLLDHPLRQNESISAGFVTRMVELGVAKDRIRIASATGQTALAEMHVLWDAQPCSDAIAVAEALGCGVPVMAYEGAMVGADDRLALSARCATSILRDAGLGEWVSASWQALHDRSVALATQPAYYSAVRAELSESMARLSAERTRRFTAAMIGLLKKLMQKKSA